MEKFLRRILGYQADREVDQALRSLELTWSRTSYLRLISSEDSAQIAYALHRRARPDAAFIGCFHQQSHTRRDDVATLPCEPRMLDAIAAAAPDGTIAIKDYRPPLDRRTSLAVLRESDVRIIVCYHHDDSRLILPAPVIVPPFDARPVAERVRVVDDYSDDAYVSLRSLRGNRPLSEVARKWILGHCGTLHAVDDATRKLLAVEATDAIGQASRLLGIAHISLYRWLQRRHLLVDTLVKRQLERGIATRTRTMEAGDLDNGKMDSARDPT